MDIAIDLTAEEPKIKKVVVNLEDEEAGAEDIDAADVEIKEEDNIAIIPNLGNEGQQDDDDQVLQNGEADADLRDAEQQEAATGANQMEGKSKHKAADADVGDGMEQDGLAEPHKETGDANKEHEIADASALPMRLAEESLRLPGSYEEDEEV